MPCDQLVCIDDGSKDGTGELMEGFGHLNKIVIHNDEPGGVCQAYNQAAVLATGDWILGCSDDDELQPGAIDAWRQATIRHRQAKVMFGDIVGHKPLAWCDPGGFIRPENVYRCWQHPNGWSTHGAAAFISRDVWGDGYPLKLEWCADWFQTFILGLRYGVVYLGKPISNLNVADDSYSNAHSDANRYNKVVREMRRELAKDEYADVWEMAMLHNYETGFLRERN